MGREAVTDHSTKPLLKPRWAAAIDTVGGVMLSTILRSTNERGCVTACGLVGGMELPLTVYPFILRGVTLAGINSATYPAQRRSDIWKKLAGPWKPKLLERTGHRSVAGRNWSRKFKIFWPAASSGASS